VLAKRNEARAPEWATLKKNRSLAVVYKMHGCLYKELKEQDDGLVVTDADYVDFISQLDKIIPAHVGGLLGTRQILFLGYSFSDWNVRSVYERAISRRGRAKDRDYAVTRSLSQFEQVYFKNRDLV
jgi:SIR2-like domain